MESGASLAGGGGSRTTHVGSSGGTKPHHVSGGGGNGGNGGNGGGGSAYAPIIMESFTLGWLNMVIQSMWGPVLERWVSGFATDKLQLILNEVREGAIWGFNKQKRGESRRRRT